MTQPKAASAGAVLGKLLTGMLAVFALSVPLFYLDAARTLAGHRIPFLYITLRAARLAAAAAIGFHLRAPEKARRCLLPGALLCAVLLVWGANGVTAVYYGIGQSLGLLYPAGGPLLPSVLWEQFLNGDLLWALTLCTAAASLPFPLPEKKRSTER